MSDEVEQINIHGSISKIMSPVVEVEDEVVEDFQPPNDLMAMLDDRPIKPQPFSPLDYNDEQREHRRKNLKKIKLYIANYKFLEPVDIQDLEQNQKNERIDYVVEDIEFQLSSRKSFEPALMGYKLGCMTLENVSKKMGMKTHGLATICTTDDAILDTFKECMIKYDGSMNVPCEYRLAFSISMVMFSLHSQNKLNEKIEKESNCPAPINENFSNEMDKTDQTINENDE